jgi:hypothetical protein
MSPDANPADLAYAFRVVAGDTPPRSDRPFTDFGQHGPNMIDKRCLLQTETWVDRAGTPCQLADMTPGYRANVLEHLRQEAAAWIRGAYAVAVTLALYGVIDVRQANREIAAAHALPPGWTDHTPLGHELHRLNGTTPPPLPPQVLPVTAADSDSPEVLRDHDTGSWTITTQSHSRYEIDLDRRRVRRIPATPSNGDRPGKPLPADGDWTALAGIVDCAVGRIMVILDFRDGQDSYRFSTTVQRIQANPPREPELPAS